MRRAIFAMLVACGSPARTQSVEIAQPLPTVTPSASTSSTPVAMTVTPPREDADFRDLRSPPRPLKLLQNEAAILERLSSQMAATSTDRPEVLLRLADTYVELRKSGDASASPKAIAEYSELVKSFPGYARIDEARYYLGLELELARDYSQARRAYYDLIKTAPSSRFVPYAYYGFGEMFADEAKGDPSKWSLAEQAYRETMKFTSSPIANAATCKLAAVFEAQGDTKRAVDTRLRAHDCGGA